MKNNVNNELNVRVVVFLFLFAVMFFGVRWYQSYDRDKVQKGLLQDAIARVEFLESNQGDWAEICNAIQAVTVRASKQQNGAVYQDYNAKYQDNQCDPLNPVIK